MGPERNPGPVRQFRGHRLVESLRAVKAGPHRRAAQSQLFQPGQRGLYVLAVRLQHAEPAVDLLGEPDRGGVLQMGASAFDFVLVFRDEPIQGLA